MSNLGRARLLSMSAWVLLCSAPGAAGTERYEAVFADGSRAVGDKVSGWGKFPGAAKLEQTALSDKNRPLRWFCDRKLKAWGPRANESYVEFVGGDRIVGFLQGAGGAEAGVPEHLLFRPAIPNRRRSRAIRILPGRIERVVFHHDSRRRLAPGVACRRDGRKIMFFGLRFKDRTAALLLKNGVREINFSELAEIRMPRIDPWKAYWRELAVMSPACKSRMIRLETIGGLIATASSLRFAVSAYASDAQQRTAEARIRSLRERIAKARNDGEDIQQELHGARERRRVGEVESKKQQQAERQAHKKALEDIRRRIDEGAKPGDKPTTNPDKQSPAERARDEERGRKEYQRLASASEKELQKRIQEIQSQLSKTQSKTQKQSDDATRRWDSNQRVLGTLKSQLAAAIGSGENPNNWRHIVQPVWSLDPLEIPFTRIRMRWSFRPEQVPLSRIPPSSAIRPPFLPERADRNLDGQPLGSGGRMYAWGFAVHAYSELHFPLPKCAVAFHGRVGLDHSVAAGGCARGRVYVGSTKGPGAYESPLLTGSTGTASSVRAPIKLLDDAPRVLILQADPVNRGAPPRADPLNIRDSLDWLDPRLELDKPQLKRHVTPHIGPMLMLSKQWSVRSVLRGACNWTSQFHQPAGLFRPRFQTMVQAKGHPLRIGRKMKIEPGDKWLAVHVNSVGEASPADNAVVLQIAGRTIRAQKVPVKQSWRRNPAPLLFSLAGYQGRTESLELIQAVGGQPLHWQGIRTMSARPPEYRMAEMIKLVGASDMPIPFELGQALMSPKVPDDRKLAALEINRLGGSVSFIRQPGTHRPSYRIPDVLIAKGWIGGDKALGEALATFRKMRILEEIVISKDSGVSDAAIAKLKTELPKVRINRTIQRVESHYKGGRAPVTWRNLTDRRVVVLYVRQKSGVQFSAYLEPGQALPVTSNGGSRLEAHYVRKGFTNPKQYRFILPLTTCHSAPGRVWDIKPPGR